MTNLSTEAKAELQRMIDIGATHMRTQGRCSVGGVGLDDSCQYRGPNGSKCFIGALIHDEHYSQDLEGSAVRGDGTIVLEALESSGYRIDVELAEALNYAQHMLHDNLEQASDFPAAFEGALVSYCSEYELDYTAPGET
jgi:hypothetical protein